MKGMRDGYRNECKACNLARRRAAYAANPRPAIERVERWRRENPELYAAKTRKYRESGRYAEVARRSHLKRTFGITQEQLPLRTASGLLPARPLPFDELAGLHIMPMIGELVLRLLPTAEQRFMREPHRWCRTFGRGDE